MMDDPEEVFLTMLDELRKTPVVRRAGQRGQRAETRLLARLGDADFRLFLDYEEAFVRENAAMLRALYQRLYTPEPEVC